MTYSVCGGNLQSTSVCGGNSQFVLSMVCTASAGSACSKQYSCVFCFIPKMLNANFPRISFGDFKTFCDGTAGGTKLNRFLQDDMDIKRVNMGC